MKGLFIKDLQLLKGQKQSYFPGLVIGVAFVLFGSNTSFAAMYLTLLFATITYSTISFDQTSNGMSYLLTLPISRSIYVKEKYVLYLLNTVFCMLLSVVLTRVSFLVGHTAVPGGALATAAISSLVMSVLMQSFMIPLLLRFGAEKSRTALAVFLGGVYLVGFTAWMLIRKFEIDLSSALHLITVTNTAAAVTGICIAMAILTAASFMISLQIMKKKEF